MVMVMRAPFVYLLSFVVCEVQALNHKGHELHTGKSMKDPRLAELTRIALPEELVMSSA